MKEDNMQGIPREGLRSNWTVESIAADRNYIDVLTLYRRRLLTDSWVSFVPMLGWRGVAKVHASRYSVTPPEPYRVEWLGLRWL